MTSFQLDTSVLTARSIGDKVEKFYLSLGTLPTPDADIPDLYQVAECLQHVEEHQPIRPLGETSQVVDEIALDCRRKAAQCIRNAYTGQVQGMIVSCRKRLISKINRNASDEDAKNHGSRHFNLLKELLGRWSNIVHEISGLGLSLETIHAILKPMHARVLDCSLDCMRQFQKDKNLESWHQRVLNASRHDDGTVNNSNGSGSGSGGGGVLPFSILTLDNLVAQVAAMREIVGTYYAFLDKYSIEGGGPSDADTGTGTPSPFSTSTVFIYDVTELNQWRELDVMYMSLESGYLSHAVAEATQEAALVEVQTGVMVPQCIEDTFFIVTRVAERCMSTLAHQALMMIANRILEIVDVSNAARALEQEPNNVALQRRPPMLLQEQRVFRGCSRRGAIDLAILTALAAHDKDSSSNDHGGDYHSTSALSLPASRNNTGSNSSSSSSSCSGSSSECGNQGGLPASGSASNLSNLKGKIGGLVGSELAEELRVGAEVLTDVSSAVVGLASGWWGGNTDVGATAIAPAGAGGASGVSNALPLESKSNGSFNGGSNSNDSTNDLAGALIAALEADSGSSIDKHQQQCQEHPNHNTTGGLSSAMKGLGLSFGGDSSGGGADLILGCYNSHQSRYSNSGSNNPNQRALSTPDWAVFLNSLNATRLGIVNIRLLFGEALGDTNPTSTGDGHGNHDLSSLSPQQVQLSSTVQLAMTELAQAERVYADWFSRHVEDLFLEPFLLYVATPLAEEVFANSDHYDIDADEMDRRSSGVGEGSRGMLLVRIVEAFIHKKAGVGGANVDSSISGNGSGGGSGGNSKSKSNSASVTNLLAAGAGAADGDDEAEAERQERARQRELEEEAERVAAFSLLDRCVRPYCSNVTYSAILHQLAEFTCEQLLMEIVGEEEDEEDDEDREGGGEEERKRATTSNGYDNKKRSGDREGYSSGSNSSSGRRRVGGARFSEWGALLFNQEVLAAIEVFELADELVNTRNQAPGACTTTTDTAGAADNKSGSTTTNNNIRNLFYPLLWALKLLTLDRPGDVSRYRLTADTFAMLESSSSGGRDSEHVITGSGRRSSSSVRQQSGRRSDAEITVDIAKQVLARRVDFSEVTISKLKINLI